MNRRDFDIDHIDPRWEDGRDYQLVCGLDCPLNYREEEPSKNTSKSNRFLPWRWSRDEIGVVPEEPGDLAFFLVGADIENDVPGEWVLMEFLSDEWFEASIGTCVRSHRNFDWRPLRQGYEVFKRNNPDHYNRVVANLVEAGHKWRSENPEHYETHAAHMRSTLKQKEEENPDLRAKRMAKIREKNLAKWQCTVTGKVSNARGLTVYQLNRGIDPSNRTRLQ